MFCNLFDTLCLRKILSTPYPRHTTTKVLSTVHTVSEKCDKLSHFSATVWTGFNDTVQSITACSPVSSWVKSLRLSFFGHLTRTAPEEDHHRVIAATLRPPAEWRRPVGHLRTTWLRTIDDDLQSLSFGVHRRKARDRDV